MEKPSFIGLPFESATEKANSLGFRSHFFNMASNEEYVAIPPPAGSVVVEESFSDNKVFLYVNHPTFDNKTTQVPATVFDKNVMKTPVSHATSTQYFVSGWYPINDATLKYWDGSQWCWPEYDRVESEVEPADNAYIMNRERPWIYLVWTNHTFVPADGVVNNTAMVETALYNIDDYGVYIQTKDTNPMMKWALREQKVRDGSFPSANSFKALAKVSAHWVVESDGRKYFWDGKQNRILSPHVLYSRSAKAINFRGLENMGSIFMVCGVAVALIAFIFGDTTQSPSGTAPSGLSVGFIVFGVILVIVGWLIRSARRRKPKSKKWSFYTPMPFSADKPVDDSIFVLNQDFAENNLKIFAEQYHLPVVEFSENDFECSSSLLVTGLGTEKGDTSSGWATGTHMPLSSNKTTRCAVGEGNEKIYADFIKTNLISTTSSTSSGKERYQKIKGFWLCSYVFEGKYAIAPITINPENIATRVWGKLSRIDNDKTDNDVEQKKFNKNFIVESEISNHPLLQPSVLAVLNDAYGKGYDYFFSGDRLVVVSSDENTDVAHLYFHVQKLASAVPEYIFV